MVAFLRYCVGGLALVSSITFAADRVVVVEPSQLQKTYTPGSGSYAFKDSRSWAEPVSVQNGRINVPVTSGRSFGWAKFRNALKTGLKTNPGTIALNGAIAAGLAAVGYVMDNASSNLQKRNDTHTYDTANFYYSGTGVNGPKHATVQAAYDYLVATTPPQGYNTPYLTINTPGVYYAGWSGGQVAKFNRVNSTYGNVNVLPIHAYGTCSKAVTAVGCPVTTETTFDPISTAELDSFGDTVSLTPQNAADLAPDLSNIPGSFDYPDLSEFGGPASVQGEPVTTTTTTPTGDSTVTTTTPSYSFDYSTNPLSITTTTTNTTTVYNNGTLVSTTTNTNAGTVNPVEPVKPEEQITDCEFMPTVCAWLDWFKSPAPPPNSPDVPMISGNDFEKSFAGPSLSATCPAPFTVTTGFTGAVSIPVTPLCDLASLIRYLVLSAAGLLAAFIISGTRRA